MSTFRAGRLGLLAALCAATLSTAALAAGTLRDETTLLVRTSAGAIERLTFEGELADGERRGLTTATGNPATLSRAGDGMVLELAGERFDIRVPPVAIEEDGAVAVTPGEGKRHVVIHRHHDKKEAVDGATSSTTETRKVVKIVHKGAGDGAQGDPAEVEAEALALSMAGGDPELLMLEGEGPKVLVMRRIVHGDGTP